MKRPKIGNALFIIFMLTAALLGVSYLASEWLGTPFVPADLAAWLGDRGQGPWNAATDLAHDGLDNLGIGSMVPATTVDQFLAIIAFFVLAFIVGFGVYAFTGGREHRPDFIDGLVGLVAGILFGAPMIFISLSGDTSILPAAINIAWLGLLFLGWGVALSYSFARVMIPVLPQPPEVLAIEPSDDDDVIEDLDGEEPGEELLETSLVVERETIKEDPQSIMGRRQFLLRFGASTAAIAAGSAVAGRALAYEIDEDRARVPLPLAEPDFLEAQQELFGQFRRFAIVRNVAVTPEESNVLALGAEYPDRNYISVWIGDGSPIIIYENLETAIKAFSVADQPAAVYWLDN
ncbi:MAG: hypothetical protein R6X18_06555 [Chloroflexota bacterium]